MKTFTMNDVTVEVDIREAPPSIDELLDTLEIIWGLCALYYEFVNKHHSVVGPYNNPANGYSRPTSDSRAIKHAIKQTIQERLGCHIRKNPSGTRTQCQLFEEGSCSQELTRLNKSFTFQMRSPEPVTRMTR